MNGDIYLDPNINWIDQLSPGEVQRLNLARVLYHKPMVAFLDESTTAVPESMEERIISEITATNGTTIITCGHRQSLKKYHKFELQINHDHSIQLAQLNDD